MMAVQLVPDGIPDATPEHVAKLWASRICKELKRGVDGAINAGRYLASARADIPHGDWAPWVHDSVGISRSYATMLMQIGTHPTISNGEHAHHLPADVTSLRQLSRLAPGALEEKIADGTVTPAMSRADASRLVRELGPDQPPKPKTAEAERRARLRRVDKAITDIQQAAELGELTQEVRTRLADLIGAKLS